MRDFKRPSVPLLRFLAVERFTGVLFDSPVEVAPGMGAIFRPAGHILGVSQHHFRTCERHE